MSKRRRSTARPKARYRPRPVKSHEKPRKRSSAKPGTRYKALTVAVFAMLLFYLLGYIVVFMSRPSVPTETVNYGTIDNPKTLNGLIIRDEYVVNSSMTGETSYNYAENSKVPKNAVVCTVKDTGTSNDIESQIKKIDKDILSAQESRKDISKNKDEIDRIENGIANDVDNTAYKFSSGNISDVYSLKTNIQNYIDMRNEIFISEITSSTAELTQQRKEYEKELSGSVSRYTAEKSGVLSFMVDGFEDKFTPETVETITKEQINEEIKPEYISKGVAAKEGSPLFKVVESNKWYLVSYVPNEMAAKWENGDTLEIYTMYDDTELSAEMKIESTRLGDTETYVVLSSDENMIEFLQLRSLTFNIRQNAYTGLKIPNTAIIEKTFLKIPLACVVDNLGQKTVILRNGSSDQTVNIDVFTSDEQFAYVLQDYKTLKIGDTLLMGSGESASDFKISEVENYKCVYVANSSMADYAVIEIVGQNSEYSIVKPSSTSHGLKVYDKIVSDAKSVENDEALN
ncbi:hypothetical protein MUJ63_10865 [Lachnospiraceae bacterium NSJ-143]|nr:hypothetical protein [Lachnospiraceae bacterium NSJ-143]